MPILLIGTLDTKGLELAYVRDRLHSQGFSTLVLDAGSSGSPTFTPDIPRETLFEKAGTSLTEIQARADRGHAVASAAAGAAPLVAELHQNTPLEGIFALGGSAGTTIGAAAMRALPFGLPKVLVTTLASGQTRPYLAGADITLVPAIADLAGLNRITRQVLSNAADALAGMVQGRRNQPPEPPDPARPVITATMFGVTTPCVTVARTDLESRGCEVLVFHATGVGGQAMESLIRSGQINGVLDLTTTELADELVGGVLSAGPDRLKAAIQAGLPQVISLGALDMVNFGPIETVPDRFRDRLFQIHNPTITLMRTTPAENAAIGRRIVATLQPAQRPITLLIPRQGLSALDAPGMPFHQPDANLALFTALHQGLANHPWVAIKDCDLHINDPAFAHQAADTLTRLMNTASARKDSPLP